MSKSGPGNIGGQSPQPTPETQPPARPRPVEVSGARATRLQSGALVRGTLLQSPVRGRASIMLPTGAVDAVVQTDSLRRGDTVLFRVESAGERLLLRVEGVPGASIGASIDNAEILRILGRPVNRLDLSIVEFLRGREGGTVHAETLRELHAAVRGLAGRVDLRNLEPALRTLLKLMHLDLPRDEVWFSRLLPLFSARNSYAADLAELRGLAARGDSVLTSLTAEIDKALERSRASISDLMRFFAMGAPDSGRDNLYNILRAFVHGDGDAAKPNAGASARRLAEGMLDGMEAQRLHNWRAAERGAPLLFALAVPLGEDFVPARIEVETRRGGRGGKDAPSRFRFSSELSALGRIGAGGSLHRRMLSLTLDAVDAVDAARLEEQSPTLLESLRAAHFTVREFKVRVTGGGDSLDASSAAARSIDIVV